jgi:hypothetical protein
VSGEASKKSGELGENLAKELLRLIGWSPSISTITIKCAYPQKHDRTSHGDDRLFIYNSPFLEGVTDVVHVSVKHQIGGYSSTASGIRSKLKDHLTELNAIVSCAKVSPEVQEVLNSYRGKPKKNHRGLLVWVHSDRDALERDIRQDLGDIQLSREHSTPTILIDAGRASFIFLSIRHYESLGLGEYSFYYPRLGNSLSADHERFGKHLPLELIASDVIPIRGDKDGKPTLYLYVRDKFSVSAFIKAYALALDFGDAWVENINIGFEDYNESIHSQSRDQALMAFSNHVKNVSVFSYKVSLLSLLEGQS